ncbi:G-protein coupled receptor 4 isoform X2 [Esox lucius]|uniref:G-protein coupled receptors family 1 profile domain-containing protein n=1 Tax=Esox lucius TaxID=8010 RepID=A0AAY5JZE4_ESOLU|nr:G-protein coupled receptor 4 isoform X2 [Esox lucius]
MSCIAFFSKGLALLVEFMFQGVWRHGEAMCLLSVILLYTNFYTSDGLLCCIAMNRYLAVVHPLKYGTLRRVDTAVGISMVIWVLVVSLNTATVIWVKSDKSQEDICFQLLETKKLKQVSVTRFVLGFLFPILMVSFCCRGICIAVRSNRATEEQERRRVSRLLRVVLLTLGLCFGPIHIIMLLCSFCTGCGIPCHLMYNVSLTMSALNILADPFLYCFVTRLGKAHVTQVVHFLKRTKEEKNQESVRFDSFQPPTSFLGPE